jgi:hypothetical protein
LGSTRAELKGDRSSILLDPCILGLGT